MTPEDSVGKCDKWDGQWGGCYCCNCRYLAADMSHPDTDGGKVDQQRGWVCLAPEMFRETEGRLRAEVCSGWPEHGLCEMHDWQKRLGENPAL